MLKYIFIFTIAMGGFTHLDAQPIRENTFEQKVDAAKEAEEQENYAGALEWYEQAYDEIRRGSRGNPLVKKFALKIAELNYYLRDYDASSSYYSRVLKNDDEFEFIDERLMYGKSLKQEAKYDLALEVLNEFISLSDKEELIREAEFQIAGIELLREIVPNIEAFIKPLDDKNVNGQSGEYSPREAPDKRLYFSAFDNKDPIKVDDDAEEYHAKIYVTAKDDEDEYEKRTELDQMVNRKDFHNMYPAISRDGRVMYFTRIQTEGTDVTSTQILRSYNRDTGWSAADLVPDINGEWTTKHPAVGQLFGQDVLFFVSDRPGGEGGLDIYYSTIQGENSMSAPVNLGPGINTPGDDISPFYYEGTLYFSSDGRPTIGGYDIFYSVWDGSEWSAAENMGLGYNSSVDDMFLSFSDDGKSGFFTSNRPYDSKRRLMSKTCCDDIFAFKIQEMVIDLLAVVVNIEEEPINNVTMALKNLTDSENYPTDTKFNALSNEFRFLLDSDFSYSAVITADGYYPDTIEFNTAGILDNYTVKKKVVLEKKPDETQITEVVTKEKAIRLDNIYYDFDDYQILPDAEKDLNILLELMNQYPELVIELSSHTDSRGLTTYNEDLSLRRAESAKSWLVERGIEPDRIKAVGYGESRILNECTNGVRCTEEEHRLNRRTEFIMLEGPEGIEITREIPSSGN